MSLQIHKEADFDLDFLVRLNELYQDLFQEGANPLIPLNDDLKSQHPDLDA
ncbi:MAG: hypothetical protein ACHQJ6_02630 [Candidatus Berkiellales bacterium]